MNAVQKEKSRFIEDLWEALKPYCPELSSMNYVSDGVEEIITKTPDGTVQIDIDYRGSAKEKHMSDHESDTCNRV